MEIKGEYRIPAPRQKVWEGLNDPEILKASIPGCEELTKLSDTEMDGKVRAKVGPVSARFSGKVTLSEIDAPKSYRITGEGQGGVAGFAKGGAKVELAEDGGETVLTYVADAAVGGKLAQIGSRLIEQTSRKMADQFFSKFSEVISGGGAAAAPAGETAQPEQQPQAAETAPASEPATAPAQQPAAPSTEASGGGVSPWVWIAGIVVVVAVVWLIFG